MDSDFHIKRHKFVVVRYLFWRHPGYGRLYRVCARDVIKFSKPPHVLFSSGTRGTKFIKTIDCKVDDVKNFSRHQHDKYR